MPFRIEALTREKPQGDFFSPSIALIGEKDQPMMGVDPLLTVMFKVAADERIAEFDRIRKQLHECDLKPDYLFGDGLSATVRNWPPDGDEERESRMGYLKGSGEVLRISLPVGPNGDNWLDALGKIIAARRTRDAFFCEEITKAFGLEEIYSQGGSLIAGALMVHHRTGMVRIIDVFGHPFFKVDLDRKGSFNPARASDLAALAFVPDSFWYRCRRVGSQFLVARPGNVRPQKNVCYLHVVRERILGGSIARATPISKKEAERIRIVNNSPLFVLNLDAPTSYPI